MLWLSDLKGRKVIDHGQNIGKVRFLTFNPDTMRTMMVGVRKFFWNRDQVIGWNSVTLSGERVIGSMMKPRPQRDALGWSLVPLPVFTESSQFVGAVVDVAVDEHSGDLLKIETRATSFVPALTIDRSAIVSITEREIRVRDGVVPVTGEAESSITFTAASPVLQKRT